MAKILQAIVLSILILCKQNQMQGRVFFVKTVFPSPTLFACLLFSAKRKKINSIFHDFCRVTNSMYLIDSNINALPMEIRVIYFCHFSSKTAENSQSSQHWTWIKRLHFIGFQNCYFFKVTVEVKLNFTSKLQVLLFPLQILTFFFCFFKYPWSQSKEVQTFTLRLAVQLSSNAQ